MPAAYHHGVETIRVNGGSVPVAQADGAIVGIIGTAPTGAVNELVQCVTKKDFAQFGTHLSQGFSLPDALDILSRYQAGKVYVVNVLDPKKHKTKTSETLHNLDRDTLIAKTAKPQLILSSVVIKVNSQMYYSGNYTITPETGEIKFKSMPEHTPTIEYEYIDPAKVNSTDIKGAVDALTGKRTGFEALKNGFNLYGADAKIIIVPQYDKDAGVAAMLATLAEQLHAVAYIDAPVGTSLSKAISGRGNQGTINFQTSSDRVQLFFPHVIGENRTLESLATHAAGLRLLTDVEQGYWFSTSNHNLRGVIGSEVALTSRLDDSQSETNLLNAQGISTVFNSFGTGFRLWGNRNASYPTNTHISNFETVQRTADLIDESIRRTQLQYMDRPIDQALLDSLLGTIETYMASLQSIVGFAVSLDADTDLVDAFSKGQVPLQYEFTPKIPAERITNKSIVTRKYLANLVSK